MDIHIICPFSRGFMIPVLIKYLKPCNIQFYPVCDSKEMEYFKNNTESWIHPVSCPPLTIPGDQAYRKLNDFIDSQTIVDDDYYGFMGDDDMYEPGFFDTIRQHESDIIFCSLYRGDTIPEGAHPHPAKPLIIRGPESVRVYNIGLPQYIIKGRILKKIRFNNANNFDDGLFAEDLLKRFKNILFLPDLFVFGNSFYPCRYTSSKNFIKPEWRLPEL